MSQEDQDGKRSARSLRLHRRARGAAVPRSRGGSLKRAFHPFPPIQSVTANAAGDGRKGKQGLECPSPP